MLRTDSPMQVRVLSDKVGSSEYSSLANNEIGLIYRLENLKYFVGIESVVITAVEVLAIESDWMSHILSLCLANKAKVDIIFDSQTSEREKQDLVLFKMLRVHNLKLLESNTNGILLEYQGKTILPSNTPKPKKYLIADVMWEFLVKIPIIPRMAKHIYWTFLKIRERIR